MKFLVTLFIFIVLSQQVACRHRPIDMVALEESIKEDILYEMSIPHRRCGHKLISDVTRICSSGPTDIIFAQKPTHHHSIQRMCCVHKCSDLDLLYVCGDRKNSDLFYELEK